MGRKEEAEAEEEEEGRCLQPREGIPLEPEAWPEAGLAGVAGRGQGRKAMDEERKRRRKLIRETVRSDDGAEREYEREE